jgi:N-acetylglutamate synthase-like GNAT family acetyltransferase
MSIYNPRPAEKSEAAMLSSLAMRSKAIWGYSKESMKQFEGELTISASDLDENLVMIAEEEDVIVGFYTLAIHQSVGELVSLFLEPNEIGQGKGRKLFATALSQAKALGIVSLTMIADPNASGFYEHMGADIIGGTNSASLPDRILPLFTINTDVNILE